jgi:hypothetical protein
MLGLQLGLANYLFILRRLFTHWLLSTLIMTKWLQIVILHIFTELNSLSFLLGVTTWVTTWVTTFLHFELLTLKYEQNLIKYQHFRRNRILDVTDVPTILIITVKFMYVHVRFLVVTVHDLRTIIAATK